MFRYWGAIVAKHAPQNIKPIKINTHTMNKEQSNTRKMKRSKPAKSFAEQVEVRKKKIAEMPKWKRIFAIPLLPIMFAIWLVDRALFLLMPHASHPSFKEYLIEKSSLKMTFARIIIFGVPALIVYLLT